MEVADPAKVGNPEVLAAEVEVALRTIWMSMTISLG
jgi:hypothetical protein